MSVVEVWYCDWHEPDEAGDYVNEDEARDKGWQKLQRTENLPSGVPGSDRRWSMVVSRHICPMCQVNPEVVADVAEGKWKHEDHWPLETVKVA